MNEYLNAVIGEWLTFIKSGSVFHLSSDSILITVESTKFHLFRSLWVKIVSEFSKKGLVNGILDVPFQCFEENFAMMWVKDIAIICSALGPALASQKAKIGNGLRPILPTAVCLAIGGPSGVGKTTLITKLKNSDIGKRIKTYTAYTTRPQRENEVNGVDFNFVDLKELSLYRNDPRFVNFIEARGNWYWIDPSDFFWSRWHHKKVVHIFLVTQTHEFVEKRTLVPDLHWVWLHAEEQDLRSRLEKRKDGDVEKSLAQNQRLLTQDRTDLVSFVVLTKTDKTDFVLEETLNIIKKIEGKK